MKRRSLTSEVPLHMCLHFRLDPSFPLSHLVITDKRFSSPLPSENTKRSKGCKDFRTETGSSQGQNLALTGLFSPSSLGSVCRASHLCPSGLFTDH